jgi:hypothetical protein
MNANQGLGKVIFEDSILIEGCLQTACANRHANGRDWWIILPDNINHRFYRFLSTPEGIYGPWEQNISNPTIADTLFYLGWSEFSPNGESMLIYDVHTGTAIYDFDRCTGLLSNLRYIPADIPLHGYGTAAAFSSDSRFIYIVRGNFRKIDQFDLMASDLQTSKITIATWDGTYDFIEPLGPKLETSFGYFQHGPDGKLYNWAGNSRFMHVTNFPNRKGLQCDFKQRVLSLPYYNNGANNYYPNYRLGPIDGSACDSLGIDNHPVALYRYDLEDSTQALQLTYTDLSYYEPTYWHWDFGDGTTSQDTSPVHNYATAGIYQVCLIVGNAYSADTFCNQVMVGASGIHELVALPHVNVHPNPFTSKIQIEMPALIGTKPQFSLYNWLGQKVKSVLLDDFTNTLHVSDIPTGIYVWQLSWNGFATQQGKLIKAVK